MIRLFLSIAELSRIMLGQIFRVIGIAALAATAGIAGAFFAGTQSRAERRRDRETRR
ncbi:MAG: hypothetical protein P0Y64_18110 [Candidatus Sphingomonas colombiensis]|nr:hypothetical protein [Sphingomonas sp.]WEK43212.1 MAG: hypothetical protein P0Y64_18110 [Sphingomonas sp.]